MPGERAPLVGVQTTSLLTFYARALDYRSSHPVLHDRFADEAARRLDCDFARLGVTRDMSVAISLRGQAIDRCARDFLAAHPECQVVQIGCGLDSRFYRLAPSRDVRWYNVDFAEVIELRGRLYPEPVGDYHALAADLLDPTWLASVPADRPTLLIAEGVFPYFPPIEAQCLIAALTAHLRTGELLFDAYNSLGLWLINRHASLRNLGERLRFSLDDPREPEGWAPGLKFLEEITRHDPADLAKLSWPARAFHWLSSYSSVLKRTGRIVRYRF